MSSLSPPSASCPFAAHLWDGYIGHAALLVEGLAPGLHVDDRAGQALVVLFESHLPLPVAQQLLPLLTEEAGGQGVEDGVQGTVDGQDEDHHPGRYGPCRVVRERLALQCH